MVCVSSQAALLLSLCSRGLLAGLSRSKEGHVVTWQEEHQQHRQQQQQLLKQGGQQQAQEQGLYADDRQVRCVRCSYESEPSGQVRVSVCGWHVGVSVWVACVGVMPPSH